MGFLRFPITLVLLSIISCCLSHNHELLENHLKRTKRETFPLQVPDNFKIQTNCTIIFNTKEERAETMRRGYYMRKMTMLGTVMRISEINSNLNDYCEGPVTIIELFATEEIIFDVDFESQDSDITLVVAAPRLIIIGENRKVILNGKNGRRRGSPKKNNDTKNGADGKQGEPGGNGGFFYGFGTDFLWKTGEDGETVNQNNEKEDDYPICYFRTDDYLEYFACPYPIPFVEIASTGGVRKHHEASKTNFTIKFYVNGGNGGRGQDGGDGEKGEDGTTFNLDTNLIDRNGFVQGFETILHKRVDAPADEPQLGRGISEVILGTKPKIGGRGGSAGPGGFGGQAGGTLILSIFRISCMTYWGTFSAVVGEQGKNGANGRYGLGGLPAHPGKDIRLSVYLSPNKTIELRNVEYYPHTVSYSSSSLDNWSVTKPETKPETRIEFYTFSDAIDKYSAFTYDNLANTPNGRKQRLIFENLSCYTTEGHY